MCFCAFFFVSSNLISSGNPPKTVIISQIGNRGNAPRVGNAWKSWKSVVKKGAQAFPDLRRVHLQTKKEGLWEAGVTDSNIKNIVIV